MISEPMVCSVQPVHLTCTDTNTDVDKDNSTSTMIQQFVIAIPAKLGHVSASLFHINRKILKSSFQRNKRCIFWTSELRVMIVLVEGAYAAQHPR